MKKIFLFLFVLITAGPQNVSGQLLFSLSGDSLYAYAYTGGDEFNAPQLNLETWNNTVGGKRVYMSQDMAFDPQNVKLEEGLAKFLATKKDSLYTLWDFEIDSDVVKKEKLILADQKFKVKYAVGGILSKKKYLYGLYETRFKTEKGQGIWPAFWFQIAYKNEEIDVFELKCEKNNQIHVDVHCPSGCDAGYKNKMGLPVSYGGWLPLSGYLHDGFNIASMEWKQDEIRFYINGYPLAYFQGSLNHSFCVFLNTSVAKDGGPFSPGPAADNKWPNTFTVDYFRTWKKLELMEKCRLSIGPELVASEKYKSTYEIHPRRKSGFMYKKSKLKNDRGFVSVIRPARDSIVFTVTGDLNDPKTSIVVQHAGKEEVLTVNGKEIILKLEPKEKELLFSLRFRGKVYSKKIDLVE